jgi:hypothetical protein
MGRRGRWWFGGILAAALAWWFLQPVETSGTTPSPERTRPRDPQPAGSFSRSSAEPGPALSAGPALRSPPVNQAQAGAISGNVRNAAMLPERTVWVEATCGRRALIDEDGDFFLYGRPGECSLKAMRRQGLLTIWGDPITVTVEKNGEHEVQLSVPDWKPAGLGISLEEDEFGIRIARVHPRSPAEKYGLKTGDIILEIDGVSAADLSTHEFVEFGVGPEGTDVDLLVATDDGEHAITLTRGFVEGSDPRHEVTGNVHVEELEDGSLEVTRIPEGLSEEEVEDFLQNHPIRRSIPAPTDE